MAARGKAGMVSYVDSVIKLSDSPAAAKATGTEDYSGALGHKGLEKHISEGQKSDQLRVLPPGTKHPPKYITELTKDPVALEAQRQRLGLFEPPSQAASSSAAARSQSRGRSVGERSQSRNPQDPKRKPGPKIDPNSERQKSLARKAAKEAKRVVSEVF